ncbi:MULTISPECIES: hypothetical protein [unclassified Acinetobacter]|uniref:hypothetical protein n=1 Tax=unclassified Acinetobacter TaxID=196816 RepID=UPI0035B8D3E6
MIELTATYQRTLDPSQPCPVCKKTMEWVVGEFYHQDIEMHQCPYCQHCIFYGDHALTCHCPHCLKQRQQQLKKSLYQEKQQQRLKQRESHDDSEYLLDDLSLIDKLFLLAISINKVSHERHYQEYFEFNDFKPTLIAPSYQLFKQLQQHFIQHNYLIELEPDSEKYYTNLRLHGYREPSLLTLVEQLKSWFLSDFLQGLPYQNEQDVLETLYELMAHEAVHYCQYRCHLYQVQFYTNPALLETFKSLLKDLALTQVYFLIDKALAYLHNEKLLRKKNDQFFNTNYIKQTLVKYRSQGQTQQWETTNQPRPADLPYSQMFGIFIFDFLKLGEKAIQQPLWKCWQDIMPTLRFFVRNHCISCGSKNLKVQYFQENSVSCICLDCKQQQHYFIEK